MYLIVGLGNPGPKYEGTRHNVGFEVVDYLAAQYRISVTRLKHKALVGEGIIQGEKVILSKPQTYMNLSGESVRDMKNWYKVDNHNIIVIYDDISLPVGKLRIRPQGSAGGHNGIKSIIYQLHSDVFPRIKIGVGQPAHPEHDLADFVLGRFNEQEKEQIIKVMKNAADAVPVIIQAGVTEAMNRYNGR